MENNKLMEIIVIEERKIIIIWTMIINIHLNKIDLHLFIMIILKQMQRNLVIVHKLPIQKVLPNNLKPKRKILKIIILITMSTTLSSLIMEMKLMIWNFMIIIMIIKILLNLAKIINRNHK
jgi:hypothetical protein